MLTLLELPVDVLQLILLHLPLHALLDVARVSRALRDAVRDESTWAALFERDFPGATLADDETARQAYASSYNVILPEVENRDARPAHVLVSDDRRFVVTTEDHSFVRAYVRSQPLEPGRLHRLFIRVLRNQNINHLIGVTRVFDVSVGHTYGDHSIAVLSGNGGIWRLDGVAKLGLPGVPAGHVLGMFVDLRAVDEPLLYYVVDGLRYLKLALPVWPQYYVHQIFSNALSLIEFLQPGDPHVRSLADVLAHVPSAASAAEVRMSGDELDCVPVPAAALEAFPCLADAARVDQDEWNN